MFEADVCKAKVVIPFANVVVDCVVAPSTGQEQRSSVGLLDGFLERLQTRNGMVSRHDNGHEELDRALDVD